MGRYFEPTTRWSKEDGTPSERALGWMRALCDFVGFRDGVIPGGSLSGGYLDPSTPTTEVGLTPVAGVSTSYMRADGAPALDQDIVPTWTGAHTFDSPINAKAGAVIAKTTNIGIKVDTDAPTFGWRDITGAIEVRGTGAADPTFSIYTGTALRAYEFSATVMKETFIVFHVPHDYVPGSDLFFHAHWSNAAATPNTGTVIWGFEYTWAKGFNQEAFPATVTATATQNCPATRYQHMVAETTAQTLTGLEVDSIILVRIYRDAATDTCTDVVYLHTADIHYQSTNMATKDKAPGFYG